MLVFKYGQNTSQPCEAAVIPGSSAQSSDDEAAPQRGRPDARTSPRAGGSQAPAHGLAQRLNKTIVLVGLMGAGKSCVGKRLAACLGLPFIDADREIEEAAGCSISDYFAVHGEKTFRDGERRVIQRLLGNPMHVLATGGGAFMDASTRALIKDKALSVWLKAELDQLLKRIGRRNDRPLLQNVDPRAKLAELIDLRYPVYAEADVTVESADGPPDVTVQRVLRAIEAELGGAHQNGSNLGGSSGTTQP